MASRYWVGGTGNWESSNTTNWSASSGGTGGASYPGPADNVFFDANSGAGIVTVTTFNTNCFNLNFTGFTGTFAGGFGVDVYGLVITLSASATYTYGGAFNLSNIPLGTVVFTSNGKSIAASITIAGQTLSLADALSTTKAITLNSGTFTTNGYAVTASQLSSANSNVRTINLGSSTVTLSNATPIDFTTTTNLTFNAGTSLINLTARNVAFNGAGQTFYNVLFSWYTSFASLSTISGANTFNNLTYTAPPSVGGGSLSFSSGQIINGVLSIALGGFGNRRTTFASSTAGIAYTLRINGTPSLSDVDFRDLYVVGTAAPISGTRLGNLGGTTGITFTSKTVYWSRAGGGDWDSDSWSLTAGGATSLNNFPLAQDTATFVNTGLNSSATINFFSTVGPISSVDMSGRTNAMTFSVSTPFTIYGNFICGSGTTVSGGLTMTFAGRNTQTITSAGKTFTAAITVNSIGGTVQLADALNIGGSAFTVTNGTFTTNGYAVTTGGVNSNNTNVRTINLGASTWTPSSGISLVDTNLTFNAGTSQFNITNSANLNAGGLTFYNVTSNTGSQNTFFASHTFNNLTFTPLGSAGLSVVNFSANQTINGTLTVVGADATRRVVFQSNTSAAPRTLTVNSLSAADCDFRDIILAGAAAGSSPTRAGDCGGNSGITFPSPKTVYWNLAGTQDWGATAWATSSGGTPALNNFPLAQDTAVFDNTGSAGTVNFEASWNIGTFDASARTSAMTLGLRFANPLSQGNWLFGTGVTTTTITGGLTFNKNGTQTITSNGVQFAFAVNVSRGILQLADAFSGTSTFGFTGTNATIDAVSYNVTCSIVTNGSSTNTLKMGSGTWTLTGTVWNFGTPPTVNCGTANIVLSNNTTTARTFAGGDKVYNKLTIGGATSTSTTTFTGNNTFSELASTKTVAHTIAFGATNHAFGAWTVTGTAGNVVTITGASNCIYIVGARVSGVDYLAFGSSGMDVTSLAEFYAGANSTGGTNIILAAAPAPVIRYWRGGTGTWDVTTTTNWSDTSGGLGGFSVPTSADTVIFDSMSNATAYTVTLSATRLRCGAITFSGPLTGNVTWAGSAPLAVHGNFTLPATGLTRNYTGNITFSGSSTGKTITTNGVGLNSTITINGIGCGWALGSAISNSASFLFNAGSFDTAGYAFTTFGSLTSQNDFVRTLSFGSSTVTASSGYRFRNTNLTFNKGTSTFSSFADQAFIIYNTSANDLGSLEFYNISLTNDLTNRALSINGIVTANTVTVAAVSGASATNLSFNGNQTYNTLTLQAPANATYRTSLISSALGATRTLTLGAFTATSDYDFRDIAVTGAAAPISGTRFGDLKGNSGITFDAAKTVYWNLVAGGNWSATAWATSSGGSPSVNNFPLAQDTAVIENTGLTAGNTIAFNLNANNIGTIDMSTRTSAMTFGVNFSSSIYGNWITGTGVTYTGSANITFAGRTTQTFTSAGRPVTFVLNISSIGGSFVLQDAFVSTYNGPLTLNNGTFNLNGYSVLLSGASSFFSNSSSNVRTVAFGAGSTWTLAGSGTPWSSFATGLTITGTGTINLTSASGKNFDGSVSYPNITLNQGGAGALTINGNNTFYDITNTYSATGATTIALGITTQSLTQFTASGAAGRVLSITGTSASAPGTLIVTGATKPTVDYLSISNVRGFPTTDFLYIGNNSVNLGSYGFIFGTIPITMAITGVLASGFVGDAIASPQPQLSSASGAGNLGSLSVESYRALLGALARGQVDVFVPSINVNANSVEASGVLGTATGESLYFQAITGSGSVGNAGSFDLGTLSVDISGLAASGVLGVATASSNLPITSNEALGAIGDLTVSLLSELSSASADALLGALELNQSVAIVGVPASAIPGTMTGDALYFAAITGTVSTGAVGSTTLGPRLIPITGNAASGNVGIVWCWTPINDDQNPNWTLIPTI